MLVAHNISYFKIFLRNKKIKYPLVDIGKLSKKTKYFGKGTIIYHAIFNSGFNLQNYQAPTKPNPNSGWCEKHYFSFHQTNHPTRFFTNLAAF